MSVSKGSDGVAFEVEAPCGAILQPFTCSHKKHIEGVSKKFFQNLHKAALNDHVSTCGACQIILLEKNDRHQHEPTSISIACKAKNLVKVLSQIDEKDWNKIRDNTIRQQRVKRLIAEFNQT